MTVTEEQSNVDRVVQEVLVKKNGSPYKQAPEIRVYFRERARLLAIRKRLCADCGCSAKYKDLATRKKLCLKCLVKNEKEKQETKERKE